MSSDVTKESDRTKLSDDKLDAVCQQLQELFRSNSDALIEIYDRIHEFPPEALSVVISDNWRTLDESKRNTFISNIINLTKKDADVKIKLCLLDALAPVDSQEIFLHFKRISEQMVDSKTQLPGPKFCRMFRSIALAERKPRLTKIPLNKYSMTELDSIPAVVLSSAFRIEEKDFRHEDAHMQLQILRWLLQAEGDLIIPGEIASDILKSFRLWPLALANDFQELCDRLPASVRQKVSAGMPAFGGVANTQQKELEANPRDTIIRLLEYHDSREHKIINLEQRLEVIQNNMKACKESEADAQSKLISIRASLAEKRNELSEAETKLEAERSQCREYKSRMDELERDLEQQMNIYEDLQSKYEDALAGHEKEANALSQKIQLESKYHVNQMRDKLAELLRHDYQDIKNIEKAEMTVELGGILRDHINRIFQKLKREGIDCGK